jgi:hypothetical protein
MGWRRLVSWICYPTYFLLKIIIFGGSNSDCSKLPIGFSLHKPKFILVVLTATAVDGHCVIALSAAKYTTTTHDRRVNTPAIFGGRATLLFKTYFNAQMLRAPGSSLEWQRRRAQSGLWNMLDASQRAANLTRSLQPQQS